MAPGSVLALQLGAVPGLVAPDGKFFPETVDPDQRLRELCKLSDDPAPFAKVTSPVVLRNITEKLRAWHNEVPTGSMESVPGSCWLKLRSIQLVLMQQVAVRAHELGKSSICQGLIEQCQQAIAEEPSVPLRAFARASLDTFILAGSLPGDVTGVSAPPRPPYEAWGKRIRAIRFIDDSDSPLADNIEHFEKLGFSHVVNSDGSHTFLLSRPGAKRELEITIPTDPGRIGDNAYKFAEEVGKPGYDMVEFSGSSGEGCFARDILARDVRDATGQLLAVYHCWSNSNRSVLAANRPGLQYLCTQYLTGDDYDFVMQKHLYEGLIQEKDWTEIRAPAVAELEKSFPPDGTTIEPGQWQTHFLMPNGLGQKTDEHQSFGRWPDVREVHNLFFAPTRCLDVPAFVLPPVQDLSWITTVFDKQPFAQSLAARAGIAQPLRLRFVGHFSPNPGDERMFRFAREQDGTVSVALSSRYAQTFVYSSLPLELGAWLSGQETAFGSAVPSGAKERDQAAAALLLYAPYRSPVGEWELLSRYGLSDVDIEAVSAIASRGGPSALGEVKDLVRRSPGPGSISAPINSYLPVSLPHDLQLPARNERLDLDAIDVQALARRLGLVTQGESAFFSSRTELFSQCPTLLIEREGWRRLVGLKIDRVGNVQDAWQMPEHCARSVDELMTRQLDALERQGAGLDAGLAKSKYQEERRHGQAPVAAMSAALRAQRPTNGWPEIVQHAVKDWQSGTREMPLLSKDELHQLISALESN